VFYGFDFGVELVGQRWCLGVRLIESTPMFGGGGGGVGGGSSAAVGGFQFGGHFVTSSVFMWILVKRG
jgi:hypothetical protein